MGVSNWICGPRDISSQLGRWLFEKIPGGGEEGVVIPLVW